MIDFLTTPSNFLLLLVILVSGAGLILPLLNGKAFGTPVNPKGAITLINRDKALVIDLRGEAEFKRGHVTKARNIPADQMAKAVKTLDKTRPVVLVDQGGDVSRYVSRLMKGMGFETVYVLEGGLDAWNKEGLPLT